MMLWDLRDDDSFVQELGYVEDFGLVVVDFLLEGIWGLVFETGQRGGEE
jgi:hypothetical protein